MGSTDTNRSITALVLDDGSYYIFYSAPNSAAVNAGVLQGSGTAMNGSFSSANARDFSVEGLGVQAATISATYIPKTSFNGTVTYTNQSRSTTFTSSYNSAYDGTPSLALLAGTYTGIAGTSTATEATVLNISSGGAVHGIGSSGCIFAGTAAPRAHGNLYDLSVTFEAARCALASATLTGIAYLDVPNKRLYVAAPNAARTDGVLFVGVKP
jgi:hypothetical protein